MKKKLIYALSGLIILISLLLAYGIGYGNGTTNQWNKDAEFYQQYPIIKTVERGVEVPVYQDRSSLCLQLPGSPLIACR